MNEEIAIKAHMKKELEYLIKNIKCIDDNDIDELSLKDKYEILVNKYYNILLKEATEQREKEGKLLTKFTNSGNIISIEKDKNKIFLEKKRINSLKDDDLFNEFFLKMENMKINRAQIFGIKKYKNLYNFFESKFDLLESYDFKKLLKEIKLNKIILNEFENYCYFFLNEFANITIIKDERKKRVKLLTNDIVLEELEKENNRNIENDLYKKDELYLKDNNNKETNNNIIKNENENKERNIEDMIKEIYINNEIDIKELKIEFEEKKYNEKYINIYKLILNILGQDDENSNVKLNIDGLLEIFSLDENIRKEFQDYLISKLKDQYLKENLIKEAKEKHKLKLLKEKNENISNLKEAINIFNESKLNKKEGKIKKRIKIKHDVISILTSKNKFIIQTRENILLYDYKTYQLIARILLRLYNNIFILKKGNITGKNKMDNFSFIINPVNCKIKRYYFFNSINYELALETSNEKIIMITDINYKDKALIYSKKIKYIF